MDDAAAHCKPVLVDDDRTLGRGGDGDGLNQYMDTVTWKVLVVGLQEEVNHGVLGSLVIEILDSEEAKVIKTMTWTETLWKRWGLDFKMKLPTYPKHGNQALRSSG